MSDETITITMKRYGELVRAEFDLDALEAAGVDNWDYYDERETLKRGPEGDAYIAKLAAADRS